ncbi:Avirulence (Avh) protein [Phytophthora megakarya]|uniref:Avirulence (Avh) protein n=1 Tax=Phytophthora megakarya TaxID=4795 RepID=A0A225V6R2_9STRA|nr:Avirulence (Avh) protein [Phytophthora megakarya]
MQKGSLGRSTRHDVKNEDNGTNNYHKVGNEDADNEGNGGSVANDEERGLSLDLRKVFRGQRDATKLKNLANKNTDVKKMKALVEKSPQLKKVQTIVKENPELVKLAPVVAKNHGKLTSGQFRTVKSIAAKTSKGRGQEWVAAVFGTLFLLSFVGPSIALIIIAST